MRPPHVFRSLADAPDVYPQLILSGLDTDDAIYVCNSGAWNVSRALKDCESGKVGSLCQFSTANAIAATRTVSVDPEKVAAFAKHDRILRRPLLIVMQEGRAWLIDGHHRLQARAARGLPSFRAWRIEEKDEPRYRIRALRRDSAAGVPYDIDPMEAFQA